MIRRAYVDDLPVLRELERAAGQQFRDLGMDLVADDDPPSLEELRAFQQDDRALVFADGHDRPVAYLLVEPVDGCAHIEQVSVRPDHAHRGIGRRLIEAVASWAARCDLAGLTLTCYASVPWNGPYYRRLGFRVLADGELTEGLRSIRANEVARGLDVWPRVAMLRPLADEAVHQVSRAGWYA